MAVIGYAIAIVFSITIANYFNRRIALLVSIAWTIETVVLLFYPPLIIVQLAVIWATYILCGKYQKQKSRIEELEDILVDVPITQKEFAEKASTEQRKIISGDDHLKYLYDSLSTSRESVCIMSGWMSSYVINKKFIKILEQALNRGVKIFIGFGWEDSKGQHANNQSTQAAFSNLLNISSKFKNQLIIGKFATHEKIIVKDDDYIIIGSNNWLSNSNFKNSERSLLLFSSDLAKQESTRIKKLIEENIIRSEQNGKMIDYEVEKTNQGDSSEEEDKIYFSELSKEERSKRDLEELRKIQKNL